MSKICLVLGLFIAVGFACGIVCRITSHPSWLFPFSSQYLVFGWNCFFFFSFGLTKRSLLLCWVIAKKVLIFHAENHYQLLKCKICFVRKTEQNKNYQELKKYCQDLLFNCILVVINNKPAFNSINFMSSFHTALLFFQTGSVKVQDILLYIYYY